MDDIRLAMIGTALDFIETHLEDGVALADVAQAAHYSKYHLHRAFSGILGITPHQYARRRRLTEAARRLVRFQTPLRDLALMAGYQSQQAFSDAFCAMYKIPPAEYRRLRVFYPLQLPIRLNPEAPYPPSVRRRQRISRPGWRFLVRWWMGIPGWTRPGTFPGSRLESRGERPSSSAAETGRQARSVFAALLAWSTIWPFIRSTARWEYPCSCSRPCDAGFLRSVS